MVVGALKELSKLLARWLDYPRGDETWRAWTPGRLGLNRRLGCASARVLIERNADRA
jgi:hypothetical protein